MAVITCSSSVEGHVTNNITTIHLDPMSSGCPDHLFFASKY